MRRKEQRVCSFAPDWRNQMSKMIIVPPAGWDRMPGEFEPHTQTWMLWPERTITAPGGPARPGRFAAVARAIAALSRHHGVSTGQFLNARYQLPRMSACGNVLTTILDPRLRPDFVWMTAARARCRLGCQARGARKKGFTSLDQDTGAAESVENRTCGPLQSSLVLEGGSIHSMGRAP
jgi:agmatine/peptidylarginine deiminase